MSTNLFDCSSSSYSLATHKTRNTLSLDFEIRLAKFFSSEAETLFSKNFTINSPFSVPTIASTVSPLIFWLILYGILVCFFLAFLWISFSEGKTWIAWLRIFSTSEILYSYFALGFSLSLISTSPFSIRPSIIFFNLSLLRSEPGVPVVICRKFSQVPIYDI